MKFKNKLGFLSIFLFILIISSGIVFAEDSALPSVENGEVSGNVDIITVNPFSTKNTSAELEYEIPASVSEIQSAYVVVSTYSGSGNYTYGLTTNISLRTASTTEVLEYANLTFVNDTANDPVVYPITDLTSKQYSDYQSLINITDKVKGLSSGDTVTISVNNTELEGYIFDGRIKLIALVFAYNDNDNDKISYWLNIGQAWTKGTLTTVFKTKDFDGEYEDVALESVSLSSTDANYTLNGIELSDPIQRKGSNFIYDKWDVTDIFEMGNDTSLACTNTGKYSYKAVIQLLTVYNLEVHYIAADIKTEYSSTPSVYAGVNNTLTVKVNNYNKNFNGSVKLYIGDEELDSVDVAINAYNSTSITLVDPTIRPVTANTVNGNNNEKVNYTVVIEDADGFVLNGTDASIVLVYDGYLGKDFEYPGANPLEREFYITGDVIVLNTEDYSAAGATSRNDTYNVDLDGGVVNTALLYVSYNWDKIVGDDYNTWNTTFNGVAIAPIATYRDQSNLGGLYAKYGYGLVVYNVTELVVDGNNTFALEKISGNAAVYPSNLIVLTDKKVSAVESYVYIWEEADLLSKSYNKFVPAGFNSTFDTVDGNATLYVFAASAQPDEGNIIVNNETYTNVWNGTSNSFDTFTTEVDAGDISVYFDATGATILGLHQMVVVENPRIAVDSALKTEYTSVPTIYAGVNNTLTVTVTNNGAEIENLTVYVLLDGEEFANYTIDSLAAGASDVNNVVDLTIRPITANTVNGNDNEKVNYIVGIRGADGKIIDLANYSFVVVYDGYLGKDFEYPNAEPLLREFFITGDVIVLNTKDYSAGGATNRTDVYTVDLDDGVVNTALLYVSYNWDKNINDDFNTWNTTFNGVAIVPIASYRDQSNLGGASSKYGYGLVVYDVTELVTEGNNTFELQKISGMSAVYPSNLIVLTDKKVSAVESYVYIWEEADLLSKSYNKFVPAGFNSTFDTVDGNATLYVFAASAQKGEGNIIVNNETFTDVWSGSSYSFDTFTTEVDAGDISVYFEATGSTILGLHQMVVVENPRIAMSSNMKSEYTSTPSVYAGVNNTFTLTVNNDGADVENVTVYVLQGQNMIGNYTIDSLAAGASDINNVVDLTIRPITANTVNGNGNEKVNYTVVIMDADDNIIDLANYSFVVVYDGYLGKDFEYPSAEPLLREFVITGDVIVLNTKDYSAGAATNRTDVYTVALDEGVVNTALLYVSYNWDKNIDDDFNSWNTTFNGVAIAPIASYRDQSNLGGASAKYGYGLVVYNVTELVTEGNNTFELQKIKGNVAVYPSNLIILTDKDVSAVESTVYIWEEADLLSKSYNKFVPAGFNSNFTVIDGNATLTVFAASAQSGEGNIIVNNETYENVWSGSSYSFDIFNTPVNGTDISVYFEATGSTILGLHQMVVVENPRIAMSSNMKSEYTSTPSVYAGVNNTFTLTVNNDGADVENVTVYVLQGLRLVGNYTIDSLAAGASDINNVVDLTIRPITANTVNGNDNEKVNYIVVIMDADGKVIDLANYSFVVVYDGYLGKDFEYPNAEPLLREFIINGDVIVLNTEDYSAGAATNRTDVYEIDLNGGYVNTALLYVSYNWDKALDGDYKTWNTTFNGIAIAPIASYRDQSNLGGASAKYGYGLVVYDVSDLVIEGNNTFELQKIKGNAAVYPSNLIILTDKDASAVESTVYIWEEADLLSKSYNKFVPAGFNSNFTVIDGNATLTVFAASAQSGEGNIIVNNETYENVWSGSSYSFDVFTTPVNGTDISVYFEATGSTILGLHQMVVVENPCIAMSSDMKSEYTSVPSVYAGVNNTFALTVNNDGADVENVTVYVLEGQNVVGNFTIDSMLSGDKEVFTVVDPTIRPVTANTVNGNDNEKVNYTVVIMDADGEIIDMDTYSFVVVYDGYLGKDFEYPNALSLLWEITFTGDAIVLNTDAYSAGAATNRTDVYEVDLANGTVNRALLYVSYNWDKALDGDYKTWNATFNGVAITPIEAFRDQSNLGGASAKYGYGLVVYDVSELVVDGNNTFAFEKIKGNSAVYPSNLIVLTDKNNSAYKTAYIIEEADLLSKSYNKYVPAGFETSFEIVEGNATLYVFAASAQSGEGNIIVNNETYENVWNGSSYSFDTFTVPVNGTDINIYFEATGSTILGLHQMIIVEHENYLVIEAPDVTKYYKGPERFVVTVTDCLGTPVANKTVSITINGVTYNRTTDENGTASMALGLNSGKYNVTAAVDNNTVDSIVTILPTVNGTDVVKVFRNGTQYYATFLDSEGNYLKDGTTVNFNINGVMYERKVSGNYGLARLNINLEQGTYIITAINPVTGENAANNITVLPNIVNNTDLVKYYRNDSQYYVTIIGDDGNPVGANETVIFNINGVMYERKTNENGTARLNINLQPGDYIITAMYNGCNVANNITVLPVLSAQDITMTYKDGTQFKANLVDGQGKPLANTNVTFNINGVFYQRTTDANGVAALNINLMPGEYIITSSYNGTNIANTIKING